MELTVHILVVLAMLLVGAAGVALTLLTLPGTWFILICALLTEWLRDGTFSKWSLLGAGVLALAAEAVEFFASGAGAAKTGGSKRAALLSIAGGLLGGILGTFLIPFPILGTILGAIIGAGLAAFVAERTVLDRTWKDAARVGRGAAIGRASALVIKTGFAAVIAIQLTIAAAVP